MQAEATGRVIGGVFEGCVVESVYYPESGEGRFVVREPNGRIVEGVEAYQLAEGKFLPMLPDHFGPQVRVVLPSGLGPYDGKLVLQKAVRAFIHRYLDIHPFFEEFVANYVLATWMYDVAPVRNWLRAIGDFGTGKTRFLSVVGSLCYRAVFCTGTMRAGHMWRVQRGCRGTLILDEADYVATDVYEILKASEPSVLAMRGAWQDRQMEMRCISVWMGDRAVRADVPLVLPASFEEEAREIRDRLLRYRMETWSG